MLTTVALGFLVLTLHQANSQECIDRKKYEAQVNACCDFPQFFTSPSNYQRQACQEELKNMALDRDNQICAVKCQMEKQGILEKDRVDVKKSNELTKHLDEETRDVMARLIEMCVRITNEQRSHLTKTQYKCSFFAYGFLLCLTEKMRANCPDKYWKSGGICDKWDKLGYCDDGN
ncbi:general odorant-binding protein 66-like isoform X2 [Culex pipiens pallens]|uniref:general odorant-binding protein 66-like isoform X2 n=1 Tax=Culex pipiens pallens TaxID=42434 RepID=UPI0022AAE372|nr:general odorant-binding protein 66-like isoform X2 [Culex pipiens pallens]